MYKIILDRSIIDRFREMVNKMPWFIYEDEDKRHWNTICACMDRITDVVDYLNNKELGNEQYRRNAFDFIDFVSQSSVLIDSIVRLSKIINGDSYDIRTAISQMLFLKARSLCRISSHLNVKSFMIGNIMNISVLFAPCTLHL